MINRVTSRQFMEGALFERSDPVVIVDALTGWDRPTRWTPHGLTDLLGNKSTVVMSSADAHFGYKPTQELSDPATYSRVEMDFGSAAREILENVPGRTLYVMERSIPTEIPELMRHVVVPPWMPDKETLEIYLWFGRGTTTPLHYDSANNYFAQLFGRKRFIIFSPHDSRWLYPFAIASTAPHISYVDPDRPDLVRYGDFSRAAPIEFTVDPGEVLLLPAFWWHHVRAPDVSISVNMWWNARFEQMLEAPNAVRGLYGAYSGDRCVAFKSKYLDRTGLTLCDAARSLLQRGSNWAACILAIAAFDEYVRDTGLFAERPAACPLERLSADLAEACERLARQGKLRECGMGLKELLPELGARAVQGDDGLFRKHEVASVLDAVSPRQERYI